MMDEGAQVIIAQTNNADFGRTDENTQQLAIARLRAIETARPLVNVSTVASSARHRRPRDDDRLHPDFEPGAMAATVDLGPGTTPAVVASRAVELFVSILRARVLVLSRIRIGTRRSRRRLLLAMTPEHDAGRPSAAPELGSCPDRTTELDE